MRKEGPTGLGLDDVLEPATRVWCEEGTHVRLVQPWPRREVILTRAARSIWGVVTDRNSTGQQIIEGLRDVFSEEDILANLEMMVNRGLIRRSANFLWREEGD